MNFSASSQWSKICFGYQGIIFNRKKVLNFSQIESVSLTDSSQFFFNDFPKGSRQKNIARGTTDPGYWVCNLNQISDGSQFENIIQVTYSIPWVRCTSGNVLAFGLSDDSPEVKLPLLLSNGPSTCTKVCIGVFVQFLHLGIYPSSAPASYLSGNRVHISQEK